MIQGIKPGVVQSKVEFLKELQHIILLLKYGDLTNSSKFISSGFENVRRISRSELLSISYCNSYIFCSFSSSDNLLLSHPLCGISFFET